MGIKKTKAVISRSGSESAAECGSEARLRDVHPPTAHPSEALALGEGDHVRGCNRPRSCRRTTGLLSRDLLSRPHHRIALHGFAALLAAMPVAPGRSPCDRALLHTSPVMRRCGPGRRGDEAGIGRECGTHVGMSQRNRRWFRALARCRSETGVPLSRNIRVVRFPAGWP